MYVIFGATGNTGGQAAQVLLAKGKKVRVVGRHREKLAALEKLGAQAFLGDIENAATVREAMTGADAAYLLVPPNFVVDDFGGYQNRVNAALVEGAKATNLKHAVLLSSLGGEYESGTGPIVGLHALEEGLKRVPGLSTLVLRAAYFMPNVLANLGLMKAQGINGSPAPGNAALPLVFPPDVGHYAGERLARLDFQGHSVVSVVGPTPVSMDAATATLGNAVGKTFQYVQFPPEAALQGMIQAGLKPQMASLYVEMYKGAGEGKLSPEPGAPIERMPTTFETFANTVFAPIFRAS